MAETQNNTSHAFVRIVVPETRTGGLTQSSYLRLGAYSHDEESLVTGLTTTASGTTYTTQNLGVLTYTDKDFQANVQGAALMLIGNGHTTEVTSGDAQYTLENGNYTLSAANDVTITADANGTGGSITLNGYAINQTANGPKSVLTIGNSQTQTVGSSEDFFFGTKFSLMIGAETDLNIIGKLEVVLGYWMEIGILPHVEIFFGSDNSLIFGNQFALQFGVYFKAVTGSYINTVIGNDVKTAITSAKVCQTTDFKSAPVSDLKIVGLNGTICQTKSEMIVSELKGAELSAKQKQLLSAVTDLEAKTSGFKTVTASSFLLL